MSASKITQIIGPREVVSVSGRAFISVRRHGTVPVEDGVLASPSMDPLCIVELGPSDQNRQQMRLSVADMRMLANYFNSAADAMDAGLTVPAPAPAHASILLVTDEESGDTFFTGDLDAARVLVESDRKIEVKHYPDHVAVELLDTDSDGEDDVAEWGSAATEENALRFAFGAYFGPADSEYDETRLLRSLARGSWFESDNDRLVLPPLRVEASPFGEKGYVATHVSVYDRSTAMVVSMQNDHNGDPTITLINEDGRAWTDPCSQWMPVEDWPDADED